MSNLTKFPNGPQHKQDIGDLEAEVSQISAIVQILAMVNEEQESRCKVEQMGVLVRWLSQNMEAFATHYRSVLDQALEVRS
jgi:hypothetical protein